MDYTQAEALGAEVVQRNFVILERVLNGDSFIAVGKDFGITSSRTSQIFHKLVRQLFHMWYTDPSPDKPGFCGLVEERATENGPKEIYSPGSLGDIRIAREFWLKLLAQKKKAIDTDNPNYRLKVGDLKMSTRATNCLISVDIVYLDQLVKCTEKDLRRIVNLGQRCLDEIKAALKARSLKLSEPFGNTVAPEDETVKQKRDSTRFKEALAIIESLPERMWYWDVFITVRTKMIVSWHEQGKSAEYISHHLSCSPTEVKNILLQMGKS